MSVYDSVPKIFPILRAWFKGNLTWHLTACSSWGRQRWPTSHRHGSDDWLAIIILMTVMRISALSSMTLCRVSSTDRSNSFAIVNWPKPCTRLILGILVVLAILVSRSSNSPKLSSWPESTRPAKSSFPVLLSFWKESNVVKSNQRFTDWTFPLSLGSLCPYDTCWLSQVQVQEWDCFFPNADFIKSCCMRSHLMFSFLLLLQPTWH